MASPVRLKCAEVFQEIEQSIGVLKVNGEQRGTVVYLGDQLERENRFMQKGLSIPFGLAVTTFHNLLNFEINTRNHKNHFICDDEVNIIRNNIQIIYNISSRNPDHINAKIVYVCKQTHDRSSSSGEKQLENYIEKTARKLDMISFKAFSYEKPYLEIFPGTGNQHANLGEKVYFGGYSFDQVEPIFHRGYISSVTKGEYGWQYTIDGTIPPGFSGGPLVTQRDGKIYLIGLMLAQSNALHQSTPSRIGKAIGIGVVKDHLFSLCSPIPSREELEIKVQR